MNGKKLKSLRKNKKLSQKDLGIELNLAESTISLYESEKRTPDNGTLLDIARFFNVSTDYLLDFTDDPIDYDVAVDSIPDEYARFGMDKEDMFNFNNVKYGDEPIEKFKPKESKEPDNPDIRMIARAGRKMTPEQAKLLRKYAEFTFPDAFKDINNEGDD